MDRTVFSAGRPPAAAEARPLTVSELTAQVKGLMETSFQRVWVSGEVSNLARPRSGHLYFTLKDQGAQLRAVVWRSAAARLRFGLEDGLEVVCRGHLDVYAPRGSYQLTVEQVEPQGVGALELALRKLKEKLAGEGLFDADRKRPLPAFPQTIAVVTSPTGAAIRDFLQVVRRRWRGVRVLIVPVRVQGTGAAEEIVAAIERVNRLTVSIDVLVVTRGGGSLEDLWALNEEAVVRAIAASRIPVVSGVGHEIDVTLADLAADVRALTPSEAAERVVPSSADVEAVVRNHAERLVAAMQNRTDAVRGRLDAIADTVVFRRPLDRLHDLSRRVDELAGRSERAVVQRIGNARATMAAVAGKLDSLSPLGVLNRGYSLTYPAAGGPPVRDAAILVLEERITTRLARGQVVSRVEQIEL
jgi:exodeoxyribonuclease VII large subunit